MSYTVWVYDHDIAPHHDNDLAADTFDHLSSAVEVARERVRDTNHNTGWAKVIDNSLRGRGGDSGLVVCFGKDKNGRVYPYDAREGVAIPSPSQARSRLEQFQAKSRLNRNQARPSVTTLKF